MALVNGTANRRNWPKPNCCRRRESALLSTESVRSSLWGLCGCWKRCTTVVQRSKLAPKLTPEFYTNLIRGSFLHRF